VSAEKINQKYDIPIFMIKIEELVELAKIRSETGYESKILQYIEEKLDSLGINYERMPIDEERYNIIVAPEEKFMLNAHLDTVGEYFPPELENDILWGRGVMDDKAGVLIMLKLIEKFKDTLPVSYVFFVDEEEEGKGSKKYAEKYAHDFAITMEPTSLRVCTAEAGSLELEFEFWGKAMHGSCANKKDNAIWQGIEFINSLKSLSFLNEEHKLLGKPAINVEMFNGGDYLLAVPESAKALIDFIYLPGQTAVEIIDEVNKISKNYNVNHMIYDLSPPFELSSRKRRVREFLKYAELGGFRSWSDAQNLVDKGTPTVVFGPGALKNAHTKDEHVSVTEVTKAYNILSKVLKEWSK